MSSVFRAALLVLTAAVTAAVLSVAAGRSPAAAPAPSRELRVCADPNNLPFSNERGQGFENAIAELVAADLGRALVYTWWPQRRGFARNTLRAGVCDVIIGVPSAYELAWPTRPYYRSTYVFVTRRDRGLLVRSFDDPILRRLRIGLHMIGDDYSNVPPAQALANRSIIDNVVGYSIYGDYSKPNPPAVLIHAVAAGEIDVAVAWGPLAGYFAAREGVRLDLTAVSPEVDLPFLPFVFDIAMGVRRGDAALHAALDDVIARRQHDIDAILARFDVPGPGIGHAEPPP